MVPQGMSTLMGLDQRFLVRMALETTPGHGKAGKPSEGDYRYFSMDIRSTTAMKTFIHP